MSSCQKIFDLGRIRTCNLLIRSQTRYPLRHKTGSGCPSGFRSVVVITCASHAQGRRFEPGRKHMFWVQLLGLKGCLDGWTGGEQDGSLV